VGLAAVAACGADTPLVGVCAALALVGLGVGLFTVPNLSYVMGAISQDRQGVAGGLSQMMRMVGVVAGVAGVSLFFDARVRHHVAAQAVPVDNADAFMAAYRDSFLLVALLAALAAGVSLLRPPANRPAIG
jgi:MFS family permease